MHRSEKIYGVGSEFQSLLLRGLKLTGKYFPVLFVTVSVLPMIFEIY